MSGATIVQFWARSGKSAERIALRPCSGSPETWGAVIGAKVHLTCNPGWSPQAEALSTFTDVRDLQGTLREKGVAFKSEPDGSATGPASFTVEDPDGNMILVDHHLEAPKT